MKKYKVETIYYSDLKNKISSTRFQRSFVWTEKKQKNLIESIKRGLPIGSLMLSEKNDESGRLLVIDGLQRMTTLRNFEENKLNFVDENEIGSHQILKIISSSKKANSIYENYNQKSKDIILDKIRLTIIDLIKKSGDKKSHYLSDSITQTLIKEIAIFEDDDYKSINIEILNALDEINEILDVDKIQLPVITFTGNDSEMAEVFQKLNSEGITLSKYDIFSAKWQECHVNCKSDKELLEFVANKYRETEEIGLEIENFDEEELYETGLINTFEYAYALGKSISENCNYIYKSKKATQVDSFGFSLLTGIMNISNKDMSELGPKMSDSNINFPELKDKILYSIKHIENLLKKWNKDLNGNHIKAHSELQLASYIITFFKLNYQIHNNQIISVKNQNKNLIKRFDSYLHMHYIYDIIRGFWGGTGDTKLDEIVLNDITESRYLNGVDKHNFEASLFSWFEEQNFRTRDNFNVETKLFINYFTKMRINTNQFSTTRFDYDHVVPKSRLLKAFKNKGIKIPIGSPSNVAIMPSFDNRSKRELTYYELISQRSSAIELDIDMLDSFGYPKHDDLRFVESTENFTSNNYIHFIKNRTNYLINEFMDLFFK